MSFKKLTKAQREALVYLRGLGEVIPNPQDARSLTVLKARGMVKFRNRDGIRHAVFHDGNVEVAKRRFKRATRWFAWPADRRAEHEV